ncbi:MAG: c-type cytochrome [Chitinophagaceae bacterium]
MKSLVFSMAIFSGIVLVSIACNEGVQKDQKIVSVEDLTKDKPEVHGTELKDSDIQLGATLNKAMATSGHAIYEVKCQSCHRLTEEKLVGPGWKDVTKRRQPVWVMNMITNVEMMLDTDPEAQKLLEQCMVRMPNQNLSKDEARSVLEFMRSNDGVK